MTPSGLGLTTRTTPRTESDDPIDALQRIVASPCDAPLTDWLDSAQSAVDALPPAVSLAEARVMHSIVLQVLAHAMSRMGVSAEEDTYKLVQLAAVGPNLLGLRSVSAQLIAIWRSRLALSPTAGGDVSS